MAPKENALAKLPGKSRSWACTWNNPPADWKTHFTQEGLLCQKFVGQLEKGAEGTPHIQFGIYYKCATTFAAVQKRLPHGCHIQPCVKDARGKGGWIAWVQYCQKIETAEPGSVHHWGLELAEKTARAVREVKDPLADKDLYPWQQQIVDIIDDEPDGRTIHWVVDPVGNRGKSALCKHLAIARDDVLPCGGKAGDIKYLIAQWLKSSNPLRVVLFDLTRSREKWISYEGMEEILNGMFVSTKYECELVKFNSPHVIVFSNWEPERASVSADRWNIIHLGEEDQKEPTYLAVTLAGRPDNVGKQEEEEPQPLNSIQMDQLIADAAFAAYLAAKEAKKGKPYGWQEGDE